MAYNNSNAPFDNHNVFITKIGHLVKEMITQNDIPCYRVETGMEEHPHLHGEDQYLPVIRIITYFEDTVGKISELLQSEFDIVLERSVDKKKNKVDSFSYKHVNYIACLKHNRRDLVEYRRDADRKFEIQICSLLHDAWSGIKKELGYDDASFPEEARRDLYRVGALLEMADMEFMKIKSIVRKQGTEVQAAPAPKPAPMPEAAIPEPAPVAEAPVVAAATVEEEPPVIETLSAPEPKETVVEKVAEAVAIPATAEIISEELKTVPSISNTNVAPDGTMENKPEQPVEEKAPFFEDALVKDELKPSKPVLLDENAQMTDASLREYVTKSKLLKEIDAEIAERAGAKINQEIDIEGDVERLRFLKVHTLKQLHDRLSDNKNEIVAFAEKWIGKDNGGTFDSGISLFYLEYLLVGKKNDPAFAVEYVVKFISDNDYSARYIIPTYNSIKNLDATSFSHLSLKA